MSPFWLCLKAKKAEIGSKKTKESFFPSGSLGKESKSWLLKEEEEPLSMREEEKKSQLFTFNSSLFSHQIDFILPLFPQRLVYKLCTWISY